MISNIIGYKGSIEWDTSRPNGTPNRPLDYSKISNIGWKPKHSLSEGLEKTYNYFINNQNNCNYK
jgi:GDP-L-fucose synthase